MHLAQTWTVTPAADWNGAVELSYDVSDGTTETAATANLTVNAVNDAPTVTGPVALATLNEDNSTTVTLAELLANADDVDTGDILSAINVSVSQGNASVTDNGNDSWTITPAADWNGAVELSYDVSDGTTETAATANLTINPVNDAPVALDDDVTGDGAAVVLGFGDLGNGAVPTGYGGFNWQSANSYFHTAADLSVGFSNAQGKYVSNSFVGRDSTMTWLGAEDIDIQGLDVWGSQSNDAHVLRFDGYDDGVLVDSLSVNLGLEAPAWVDLDFASVDRLDIVVTAGDAHGTGAYAGITSGVWKMDNFTFNTAGVSTDEETAFDIDVIANDYDVDAGDSVSILSFDAVSNNGAAITQNLDGTLRYDPTAVMQTLGEGDELTDSFSYIVSDGNGGSDTATATVTVAGVNDAALISGTDTGNVTEDGVLTTGGSLTAVDIEAGESGFQAGTTAGVHGGFSIDGNGNWTYTAVDSPAIQALAAGDILSESFTVLSIDGTAGSVMVTITGSDDIPVISGTATGNVIEDGVLTAGGSLTATDVDSGESGFQASSAVGTHGSFSINASGNWSYTAVDSPVIQALGAGDTLNESFTVLTIDGTATDVMVTITGSNDIPVISGTATGNIIEDGVLTTGGSLTAADVDTGESGFQVIYQVGTHGSFGINATGTWIYSAVDSPIIQALAPGETLSDTFTVLTIDGTAANVVVTITGTNDAPVAQADVFSAVEGSVITGNVLADNGNGADSDDNGVLNVVGGTFTTAQGGTVVLQADGNFTYTPPAFVSGNDTLTYTVMDEFGLSDTATMMLDINYAPVLDADKLIALPDDAGTVAMGIDAPFDPDGDPLTITVGNLPGNGSVTLDNGTAVLAGASLTAAQLSGLKFTANDVTATENSTFTYQVSDGQNSVTGSVDFAVTDAANPGAPVAVALTEAATFNYDEMPSGQYGSFSQTGPFSSYDFGENHSKTGYYHGSMSFETENWPGSDSVALISSSDGHEFDFLGGKFSMRGYEVESGPGFTSSNSIYVSDSVRFLGYKDGAHVETSSSVNINSNGYFNIYMNFTDVDTVIMDPSHGTYTVDEKWSSTTTHKYYVADDLRINDNSSLFYDVVQDGGAGDDLLIGGDGDDRLTGNGGDDNLVGDTGDDLFVFNDGDGNDTIIDFTAGAGSDDVIDLRGDSFNNSLSELLTHASQEGADTEIDLGGGDAVTLVGVNMGDLHEDDFLFV